MTDAAGHKPLEGASGRSEQLLQIVIDSIPQRVFWKDRNCVYLGCNRSFARDAGVDDPSLIVGKNDFDLAWKATAHLYVADDRLVMESNVPKVDIDEPMTFTDGRTIWLRTSKVPLRDASGAVFGVLGTYEDVTEKRQAAIDLHESEERFRATFEQAAVGISHVSTEGRFLRVNQRLCAQLGYTREELLARTFQEITHPADLEADLENVRRMLAGEIPAYSMEKRYIRKDGTAAWIALTVSLARDDEGRPKYFISVIEDIEPRRRAEEQETRLRNQLEQAQKMESVGQLAGGIAHDFNNLLTVIPGFCELILGDENTSHRSELEEIKRAGERAAALTRQLLAFSRKQVFQLELLDLNAVVVNMETMLRRLIGEDV
ncbi:MAG: PAS domain S-box protein, partial [Thermoanaerobaculia bacterium]